MVREGWSAFWILHIDGRLMQMGLELLVEESALAQLMVTILIS